MLFTEHNRGKQVALYILVAVAFVSIITFLNNTEKISVLNFSKNNSIVDLFEENSETGSKLLNGWETTKIEVIGFKDGLEKQVKQIALVSEARNYLQNKQAQKEEESSEEDQQQEE